MRCRRACLKLVLALLQVLMYGGRKEGSGLDNGLPCNDVLQLSTDVMKWEGAAFKGALNAPTRFGHAVCCIREKVLCCCAAVLLCCCAAVLLCCSSCSSCKVHA